MSTLVWPVPGSYRVTSPFGRRKSPTAGASTDHKGIDIGGAGLNIVAAKSGTVSAHNPNSVSAGNMLVISHGDGTVTRYLHMIAGSNTVTKGDRVAAGQVIGKVGSTGYSTGPHLHFDYTINGVYVNPILYFSDSDKNLITGADTSGSITDNDTYIPVDQGIASDYGEYTGNAVPYNPDYVVPEMSSSITKGRPIHGYFKLFIGPELELTYTNDYRPNINQTFEINRLEEAGCTAQFTIFDDNWEEIESYLASNWNNIYLQYGYSEGISSPKYKMLLQDYSIDFTDTGTLLSIKAISEGVYDNIREGINHDTMTKNPGEAIKSICRYMGWKVDDSNFEKTQDVDRDDNYSLLNDYPATYILETIIPEARTANDEILTFYLNADEEKTAHLKVLTYGVGHSETDDVKTYVYQKGYDSPVVSLSFDMKGVFGGTSNLQINTALEGSVFGTYDKEEHKTAEDYSTVLTNATGMYSHTMARQSISRFTTSGESADQMRNKLFYYVKNGTTSQYEAIMTILGDTTIELFDDIRIINMTEFGHLHHTSGIYLVKGITDSVQDGIFLTTLKLQRNGDINEGVELRYPKKNVK